MKKLNQCQKQKQLRLILFTVSTQAHIQKVNAAAFRANNFVRSNVVGIKYSKQTGKVEYILLVFKTRNSCAVFNNIRKGVPQVYYSVKIRIAKTESSGSRAFKINTSSTATGTPLVERQGVANIELHQAMHTVIHCYISGLNSSYPYAVVFCGV